MGYRITVDTGGTCTDVVVVNDAGTLITGKAITTPARIFQGIEDALRVVAGQLQVDVRSLLQEADIFVYATTRATNAIIEGTTARTALLVTQGFPDVLVLREGGKLNPFDFTEPFPEPYIPRRRTFEINERVNSEGQIVVPLDEGQARSTVENVHRHAVDAVAVCFLWSIVNPVHEEAMGRLLDEVLPGIPYTLSHKLNPIIREYRRASSTAIDASLKPLMQTHLREMQEDVRTAGFRGEIFAATSFGGVMHVEDLMQRPIYAVKSGPAMAPVAGRAYGQAEISTGNVIACDTGGTSFDVSLVRDGLIKFTRETWLGKPFTGHLLGLSSVDARSIGAGGGSIAWIDSGGLLRVGPRSAGAEPGPACYGRGGDSPTVTDAALVLGYIDPDYFLGGRMCLDTHAAHRTLAALASDLAATPEQAAQAILTIANEHMVQAIEGITINEGVDPRESLLVAGGGAAGMNILSIARELGCSRVLVPRTAGVLSACGIQYSDIVTEFSVSKLAYTGDFPYATVNKTLRTITASLDEVSSRLCAKGFTQFQTDYFVEARYPYQAWELDVPLATSQFTTPSDVDAMVAAFHAVHERVFAVQEPGQQIECVYWKGRLTAFLDRPLLRTTPPDGTQPTPSRYRCAYFADLGKTETPIYLGEALTPGMVMSGPAIIEEPTTTIVVYPYASATVTDLGNYMLAVHAPAIV